MMALDWSIASNCSSRQTDGSCANDTSTQPSTSNAIRLNVRKLFMASTRFRRVGRSYVTGRSKASLSIKVSCGQGVQPGQRAGVARLQRFEPRDVHAEFVDPAVRQAVAPAVHGQRLATLPCVTHDRGVAGVADLLDHVQFAQP